MRRQVGDLFFPILCQFDAIHPARIRNQSLISVPSSIAAISTTSSHHYFLM
jgi:hypothetical protein